MWNSLPLLPLDEEEMSTAIPVVLAGLQNAGLTEDEARLKLESVFESWIEKDGAASALPLEIRPLLNSASWAGRLSKPAHSAYVEVIRKIEGKYTSTRRDAVVLLTRLPLILLLAERFSNSPARIARLLGSADALNPVSWRAVQAILIHFGIRNELDQTQVSSILVEDKTMSAEEFGDADSATAVELISSRAKAFGLGREFEVSLSRLLAPSATEPFFPYLQILLFVTVVDHFYDHPSEYIYTFKPRGAVANLIFGCFPPELAPGGNPMLNNFKAVNRITHDWAESRDENREQAESLVEIVLGLSSLSYPARKQLSGVIRRGILRVTELKTPTGIIVPDVRNMDEVGRFLENVAATPTGTRGIIEQRVTDFFGAIRHHDAAWRSRGLGDPVNASNTASRKLGDCDFQNPVTHRCHAFEAHAGKLTNLYLDEHSRTLRLNLPARILEWDSISEIENWSMEVTFIAHEDARVATGDFIPLDVPCGLRVQTFREAASEITALATGDERSALVLFRRWVLAPLNAPNTPYYAKQKAIELFC